METLEIQECHNTDCASARESLLMLLELWQEGLLGDYPQRNQMPV